MSGRKVTGLPLPETPKEAPREFHGLVEAMETVLADSDTIEAARILGRIFDYLTRYFCAVAGGAASALDLESSSVVPADFEEVRVALKERLTLLGDKATDALSKQVRSIFFVGATRKVPTPRRHARLLDLGGIPIRGYRSLGEWIDLTPGEGDLASDSKANRELLRYLPILKEWLTATATFFLDCKELKLSWTGTNEITLSLDLEGSQFPAGPITLPDALVALLPRDSSAATPAAVAPEPVSPQPQAEVSAPEPEPQAPVAVEPEAGLEPAAEAPASVEPEAASEPAAEGPVTEAAPEPVAETVEPEAAPEPVAETVEPEAAPEPAAEAPAPVEPEAAPEPVAETVEPEAAPEPVAETVEPEAAPEPVAAPVEPEPATEPVAEAPAPVEPEAASEPGAEVPAVVEPEEELSARVEPEVAAESASQVEPEHASAEGSSGPKLGRLTLPSKLRRSLPKPGAKAAEEEEIEQPGPVEETELPEPAPEPVTPDPVAADPVEDAVEDEDGDVDEFEEADGEVFDPEARPAPPPPPTSVPAPPEDFPEEGRAPIPASVLARVQEKAKKPARVQPKAEDEPLPYPWVTGPPPEFFDEIPVEADYPRVLAAALNDLNGAIEANDSLLICGQMQRCFDLMIQFFAGVCGAVIYDIDEEQLFDFEVEDGRFDLETKVEFLITSLSAMEVMWESNDVATLVWSVFYDTLVPATDPNCAYLHTRLLGVEGRIPAPLIEFTELCEVVPGKGRLAERSACRETAHRYLPILDFWLENATPLFLECEIDFVEEAEGNALSWAASLAGATLDGTPSGLWLEIDPSRWNLPRPELAPIFVVGDAPEVLLPVVDGLNNSLEAQDFTRAGVFARVCVDFLIQYFAGCAAALWREQGEMNAQAQTLYHPEASLEDKERLLMMSLGGISTGDDVGAALTKLFSKSSLQYRALARRERPDGMKALSEWAVERPETDEEELLIYLPTLRSWLGAANPWFSAGEQLFEDPTEGGRLEGVVALGDEFLEMVDPEYVICLAEEHMRMLAPEKAAAEAAPKTEADREFTGQLPQLPILVDGPPVLVGHLGRLLESADDRRATNAWLGSAFEYLIQYFAGLCTTVLGGKDAPLDPSVRQYFNPKASLREREKLLVEAIEKLKETAEGEVQVKLKNVFVAPDGGWLPHARFLGIEGAGSLDEDEMLLSYWCRQRHQVEGLSTTDYHFAVRTLTGWVQAAKPFFELCDHYAEDPGADGQEEMVLELEEDYFDMVLPEYAIQVPARGYYEILYRESDYVANQDVGLYFPEDVRPELLGPQGVELGGVADDSGEMLLGGADTGVLGGDDLFSGAAGGYDSSDLFAGAAQPDVIGDEAFSGAAPAADSPYKTKKQKEQEKAAQEQGQEKPVTAEEILEALAGKRRKKKRKSEKGAAVLALLKKERLEKARRRAEARRRKAASEPTKLAFTLQYRGLKNSKQLGGRAHLGIIEIKNNGGGELKGTVEPAHPCVKVQPARFEGNEARVIYQVDPADMPSTGRTGLVINTQDDRVELRLDRLVPSSWWSERSFTEGLALVAAPAVAYGFFLIMLLGIAAGEGFERSIAALNGDLDKLTIPTSLRLWITAVVAMLPGTTAAPYLARKIYQKLDYSIQEESFRILPILMMMPTLFMGLVLYLSPLWEFGLSNVGFSKAPAMATKFWPLLITFLLNLFATIFFAATTTTWWEENSETQVAKRARIAFWVATILLGVVVTLGLS